MTRHGGEGATWYEKLTRIAIAVLENLLSDGDTCSYALLSAGRTVVSAVAMALLAILSVRDVPRKSLERGQSEITELSASLPAFSSSAVPALSQTRIGDSPCEVSGLAS